MPPTPKVSTSERRATGILTGMMRLVEWRLLVQLVMLRSETVSSVR